MTEHAEAALEPELAVVDAHHHLWPADVEHASAIPYGLEDLGRDLDGGHEVLATVFVECSACYRPDGPEALRPVGETEWVMSMPAEHRAPAAMIGFADMRLGPDAGAVLDEHVAVGGTRFRGIRHPVAWDESPDVRRTSRAMPPHVLADPVFREGVREVAARGLIFETWGYFHQLADLADLAATYPEMVIVVDHLGGPVATGPYAADRPGTLAAWREALARVAEHENVMLKIGGIGFAPFLDEALVAGPRTSEALAAYWEPELLFCIQTFGAQRCMCESNFPVDRPTCDYVTLWNALKRATATLPPGEREQIMSATARRVYGV